MQNKEPMKKTGPKMPTPEQIRMIKEQREKRLKRMETNPEYRKHWEKRKEDFDRIALLNDSIETNI